MKTSYAVKVSKQSREALVKKCLNEPRSTTKLVFSSEIRAYRWHTGRSSNS